MNEGPVPPAPAGAALRRSLPQRLRAAGIHLGLSSLVFVVALYLILVRWYPGFHFGVDGGWQGVRIMAAVDLVLGPALTLVIFNPFKARRLIVFDLCCIGLVQVGALVWGFYAIHGQRPVSMNFLDGVFYSMPARSLRLEGMAPDLLARLSDRQPALIYVAPPETAEERARARARAGTLQAHEDPLTFRALAPHWARLQEHAVDAARVADPAFLRDLSGFLARHGGEAAGYRFFRYQAGYGGCFLAFTPDGQLVDALGCEKQ